MREFARAVIRVNDRARGNRSASSLARKAGVSLRTVGRWLSGRHIPSPEHMAGFQRWLAQLKMEELDQVSELGGNL